MLTSLLSALEKKPLCDDKPFIERQKVICKKKEYCWTSQLLRCER